MSHINTTFAFKTQDARRELADATASSTKHTEARRRSDTFLPAVAEPCHSRRTLPGDAFNDETFH